ncbi:hypothetical protein MtrunA17_Chr3g0088261 [Medicago truncatula]|uniref:Uncharacterized protein n=1 Tax=Medicago truncatula TaxID=3880 RepID=A0A396IKS4_MEDTR|nr:hypothetical protein MtrunA17_Chr3g0088261 [Medicago truncatula]
MLTYILAITSTSSSILSLTLPAFSLLQQNFPKTRSKSPCPVSFTARWNLILEALSKCRSFMGLECAIRKENMQGTKEEIVYALKFLLEVRTGDKLGFKSNCKF